MAAPTSIELARKLLAILEHDREYLLRIDNYLHGHQDDPYMPANADDEYCLIAERSTSNWMPLLVGTPAQALYVDGYRRGSDNRSDTADHQVASQSESPEWAHFERSRMASRQSAIYRGALAYGHSFVLTEKDKRDQPISKGLSPLRTAALFEDPANDETPYAVLTVTSWPSGEGTDKKLGKARLWDGTNEYPVTFGDAADPKSVSVGAGKKHGASECPVTRFAAAVDLDGRTMGVIWPMIPLQNRINQTVFDLLIAQTYGSFKVRYATGMAPPMQTEPEYDDDGVTIIGTKVKLDDAGSPIPVPMNYNARRFLFATDPEARFGTLDGTALDGYISSIDMSIRHFAAVSQTPPHYLLGQIANLSAEALLAAETSLQRKVEEFRKGFGESWRRVFRLAGELAGDAAAADDFQAEVLWRDMESRSLAQSADALGKLRDQLSIPAKGLWPRVPGVTEPELREWERLAEDEVPEEGLANAINRATTSSGRVPAPATTAPSDQ